MTIEENGPPVLTLSCFPPSARAALHGDACRQISAIEELFRSGGDHTPQLDALLTTLRCFELDPGLDRVSRDRVRGLILEFGPNGWDEV